MYIKSVMPSSHLILCRPLLLLPPVPPSIRVFSNESTLHMTWPKYWSFSLSISPSNEHPGLISLEWTGWISLQSKGLSKESSPTPQFKSINSSALSLLRPVAINRLSIVQFSRSVVSNSLRPHGLQHATPPCPLPTPGVYSNSCPLNW